MAARFGSRRLVSERLAQHLANTQKRSAGISKRLASASDVALDSLLQVTG